MRIVLILGLVLLGIACQSQNKKGSQEEKSTRQWAFVFRGAGAIDRRRLGKHSAGGSREDV
jgi:hypothetical protein